MPDLSAVLSGSAAWRRLEDAVRAGRAPQTLYAVMSPALAAEFARRYARLLLCRELSSCGACPSCRSWNSEGGHPDMIIAGPGDRAPKMDDRESRRREMDEFQSAVALRPVVAPRRLGILPYADEMSPAALNKMLKIAEEPSDGLHILFTAAEDRLLQTIKSRSWRFALDESAVRTPSQPPSSPSEWAAWLASPKPSQKRTARGADDDDAEQGGAKKTDAAAIAADARGWAVWLAERGEHRLAAAIENLLYISEKRRLPAAAVQDALHAVLREGVQVERIFGDLREA